MYSLSLVQVQTLFVIVLCTTYHEVGATDEYPKPSATDAFVRSKLTAEQKQKLLDEHNRYRGLVQPSAANMEYMVWDEDLANLAQMWSDKCIFSHGFVEFGHFYPQEPSVALRDDHLGQNLAREWGRIPDPESRVKRWYNEVNYYTYGNYGHPRQCLSGKICGHYTQLVWALSRKLGCGMTYCKQITLSSGQKTHHPQVPDDSLVNCDYTTSGNVPGQLPYKTGVPCSKCASGKGWCYQNLCRDCKNYDPECSRTLTHDMCTSKKDLMAKECPKLCNLCECPLQCQAGGTLDRAGCTCICSPGRRPPDCSEICEDRPSKAQCEKWILQKRRCDWSFIQEFCPSTCGICDDGTGTGPKPLVTSTTPPPVINPTKAPGGCKDEDPRCSTWAIERECDFSSDWMHQHCCDSCKRWNEGENSDDDQKCAVWAANGECETNKTWMLLNCRFSCNQGKDCRDEPGYNCPKRALRDECRTNAFKVLSKCRRSCGLCKVYDKENYCPAWAVIGECSANWAWMANNCPLSCAIPLSVYQFCADKPDGCYPSQTNKTGFICCKCGDTRHAAVQTE